MHAVGTRVKDECKKIYIPHDNVVAHVRIFIGCIVFSRWSIAVFILPSGIMGTKQIVCHDACRRLLSEICKLNFAHYNTLDLYTDNAQI